MYLAFIHIGGYDIKARRHLACVQNGITQLGDWRMETWHLALRARCHVSIRQSPSLCNMPFWTHAHAFSLYCCMHPANERRLYIVTSSLIGWAHTQNDPVTHALYYRIWPWVYVKNDCVITVALGINHMGFAGKQSYLWVCDHCC